MLIFEAFIRRWAWSSLERIVFWRFSSVFKSMRCWKVSLSWNYVSVQLRSLSSEDMMRIVNRRIFTRLYLFFLFLAISSVKISGKTSFHKSRKLKGFSKVYGRKGEFRLVIVRFSVGKLTEDTRKTILIRICAKKISTKSDRWPNYGEEVNYVDRDI